MPLRAAAADLYQKFLRLIGAPVRHREAFEREVEQVIRGHIESERRQMQLDALLDGPTPRTPKRRTPARTPPAACVPPIGEGRVTWLRPPDPPAAARGAAAR